MPTEQVFYDIYDFFYVPFWQTTWFRVLLLCVCLLLLLLMCFGVYRVYRMRKQQKELSLSDWALQQLETLSVEALHDQEDFKNFYHHLTSVIKRYLHKRYGWDVAHSTDEELIRFMKESNFDRELAGSIGMLLSRVQLVKFAHESSMHEIAAADIKHTAHLIARTKPIETK